MTTDDMNTAAGESAPAPSAADLLRRAAAFEKEKRFDQAAAACREALAQDSANFEGWYLLSGIELSRGQARAALDAIDRGLEHADNPQGLCRRGSILRLLKRVEEAAESQRRAIAIDPRYAEAHNNLGNCLRDLGRAREALKHYRRAVELRPDYVQALNNLGVMQRDLDRDKAALESFGRCLALKPDYANAHFNLGTTLLKMERPAPAVDVFRRTIALTPRDGAAHIHLARALSLLDRRPEAAALLDRAAALPIGNPEAEFDLSLMLLELGRLKEAWKHYEARWAMRENAHLKEVMALRSDVPQWTGGPLQGKSILVQSEQGLGDVIQFCRYIPLLAARGAAVTFLVPPVLERLLAPLAKAAAVKPKIRRDTVFDYRTALASLPGLFGTELQTIPRTEGPYLFAESERLAHWREVLGTDGFKIAICWQGNPHVRVDRGRSIPLACFAPLARLPGVRLISVQKRFGLDQLERLPADVKIERLGASFDEGPDAFMDTAAVIASCDLVVTSDTSVAHLAGALDAPTWVALSTTADWRWLRDRRDSPWYRSMTLFRQRSAGDWPAVFNQIAEALGEKLAETQTAGR